jgi:hypothetical protein
MVKPEHNSAFKQIPQAAVLIEEKRKQGFKVLSDYDASLAYLHLVVSNI